MIVSINTRLTFSILIYSSVFRLSRQHISLLSCFVFFFYKKNKSMLACRVVGYVSSNNQIVALGYVSRTNHIAALGYVTRTSNITAFGYHAPITPFGYFFFVNDVMESEGCSQRMTLTGNLGSFAKGYDCGLRKSLAEGSRDSTNQIPFCHIGLRSITCHFLVNNLHFITYSNRIIQNH